MRVAVPRCWSASSSPRSRAPCRQHLHRHTFKFTSFTFTSWISTSRRDQRRKSAAATRRRCLSAPPSALPSATPPASRSLLTHEIEMVDLDAGDLPTRRASRRRGSPLRGSRGLSGARRTRPRCRSRRTIFVYVDCPPHSNASNSPCRSSAFEVSSPTRARNFCCAGSSAPPCRPTNPNTANPTTPASAAISTISPETPRLRFGLRRAALFLRWARHFLFVIAR